MSLHYFLSYVLNSDAPAGPYAQRAWIAFEELRVPYDHKVCHTLRQNCKGIDVQPLLSIVDDERNCC